MALQVAQISNYLATKKDREAAAIEDAKRKAELENAKAKQEGGDIGGILGMIVAGIGAGAAIAATGGLAALAAPAAIGAMTGAATIGSGLGSAVGKTVAPQQDVNQSTIEAIQRRSGVAQQQPAAINSKDLTKQMSERTMQLRKSLESLTELPDEFQNEYRDVLLKGVTKSITEDLINARKGQYGLPNRNA